jgi:hypothetical protein
MITRPFRVLLAVAGRVTALWTRLEDFRWSVWDSNPLPRLERQRTRTRTVSPLDEPSTEHRVIVVSLA